MKKTINMDVTNPNSIAKTIKYMENLKKDIEKQCVEFCEQLADVGIKVAIMNSLGKMGDYVIFAKELRSQQDDECTMIMYGRDIKTIVGEDANALEVSPLLMLEYGSGAFAVPEMLIDDIKVGRGTFPGQKHAFDPKGWWYKSTKDGEWHHSYGVKPSYPMQKAYDEMQVQVDRIARRVFRLK